MGTSIEALRRQVFSHVDDDGSFTRLAEKSFLSEATVACFAYGTKRTTKYALRKIEYALERSEPQSAAKVVAFKRRAA